MVELIHDIKNLLSQVGLRPYICLYKFVLQKVRKIYNKYPSEKVQGELNEKEKTVRTLENQLRQMTVEYQVRIFI